MTTAMTTALDVHARLREAEARADFAENLITAAGVLSEAGIHPDHPDCQRLFHAIIRLPGEDAMRERVLREAASAPTSEAGKSYTDAARKHLAKEGKALPDGSYPIVNVADLKNAIQAIGRAKNPAAAKAHIIKRAKALDATDALPDDWDSSTDQDLQESVKRLEQLGVPTLDGGPLGPARLREASAAELAERGIPILDEHPHPLDDSRPSATAGQLGIPMLPEPPGSRHVRFTESESGQVLSRIS
jgi:hypothetical protein